MTESKTMTTSEVAKLWGVSVMTVHRWVESGQFTVAPERLANRQLSFDRAATEKQYQEELAAKS